ncbi:MAG: hypothetical protein C4562_00915 [Actinobacteria bacterium]|nr:MAG: hypothetical protein C4562_00915 [Actinomycetota bacterium]
MAAISLKRQAKPRRTPRNLRLVKKSQKRQVKVSYFKLFIVSSYVIAALCCLKVAQFALFNQYCLESQELKVEISKAKQAQQELATAKMILKSPNRIESIATAKLKMISPKTKSYIIYGQNKPQNKLAYLNH